MAQEIDKIYAVVVSGTVVNKIVIKDSVITGGWRPSSGTLADTTGKECEIGYMYNSGSKSFSKP